MEDAKHPKRTPENTRELFKKYKKDQHIKKIAVAGMKDKFTKKAQQNRSGSSNPRER